MEATRHPFIGANRQQPAAPGGRGQGEEAGVSKRIYIETPLRLAPPRMPLVIHPDWDRPGATMAGAYMDDMRTRLVAAVKAEIRRLLEMWVSECEPTIAWGPEGILGLALAGAPGPVRIVVPSKLATLEGCRVAMTGPAAA